MVEADLEDFLVRWREDLRLELATNSRGFLRSKQPNLSTNIPETFPSLRALKLELGWNSSTILDKFKRLIFPGLFTRRLTMVIYSHTVLDRSVTDTFQPLDLDQQIRKHIVEGCISEPPISNFFGFPSLVPKLQRSIRLRLLLEGSFSWCLRVCVHPNWLPVKLLQQQPSGLRHL
ncbi:hypothetical protein C8R47DRAFT_1083561 [Mycena vitilis]|nr:hypothetical protein C8R47DRAFT_1083561 [Mycena vitilis]